MNNRFETLFSFAINLTLGDEFQALFTLDANFPNYYLSTSRFETKPATAGIGLGKI